MPKKFCYLRERNPKPVKNGKVFVRSGAGIVADSVPEKEYRECIQKAAAVRQALQKAQEGMEA